MTISTHLAPEDIMAFLDGELPTREAQTITTHLETCDECNAIAEQFRHTSALLSQWDVPQIPSTISTPQTAGANTLHWKPWTLGFGAVAASVMLMLFIQSDSRGGHRRVTPTELAATEPNLAAKVPITPDYLRREAVAAPPAEKQAVQPSTNVASYADIGGYSAEVASPPPPKPAPPAATKMARLGGGGGPGLTQTPMIARTVSLAIQVKSVTTARTTLDAIIARHRGYSAQLTSGTAENASPTLQASLRIPAPELAATIAELKTLGRVQNETQSGEEVTQQHADLAARLTNARESETRLRSILEQRTGKVSDVLEVEEQITQVGGEIESMQAEQQTLDHRVDFATVDIQLSEQFKATLDSTDNSTSTRLHNSFVAGYRNASETILDIVLFFGEYGPALLIWTIILGVPILLAARRYRKLNPKP
jgi:hypothetical protein